MAPPQLIHFDYDMSPYGQKTNALLTALHLPYTRCEQPVVLPRPDLQALGITYRRIPLLAVGRDVYCDSALIFDVALALAQGGLARGPADKAWEAWGAETFRAVLPLLPGGIVGDEGFVKDRETIFPLLRRPDFGTLRPSALAELVRRMEFMEEVVLKERRFVGGEELGVADLHVVFGIRWALFDLGVKGEEVVGKGRFPKVWGLIEALPEVKAEKVGSEEAIKKIKAAELSVRDVEVESGDPTGLANGAQVSVESMDSAPGSHPQAGKLVGLTTKEIVLGLDSGVHLHFPREGYILRAA